MVNSQRRLVLVGGNVTGADYCALLLSPIVLWFYNGFLINFCSLSKVCCILYLLNCFSIVYRIFVIGSTQLSSLLYLSYHQPIISLPARYLTNCTSHCIFEAGLKSLPWWVLHGYPHTTIQAPMTYCNSYIIIYSFLLFLRILHIYFFIWMLCELALCVLTNPELWIMHCVVSTE